jgi:hypothetical protein
MVIGSTSGSSQVNIFAGGINPTTNSKLVIRANNIHSLTGSLQVTGSITGSSDFLINGLTVGRGGGNVSTNTAIGVSALRVNTSGIANTVIGYFGAYKNSVGNQNTAVGYGSLYENLSGSNNVSIGRDSLSNIRSGSDNVAIGWFASTYINAT